MYIYIYSCIKRVCFQRTCQTDDEGIAVRELEMRLTNSIIQFTRTLSECHKLLSLHRTDEDDADGEL